ncbi:MAG: hypothetical protein J7498_00330 [Sphingobium sp.]|nr:hypothetical protein [Sphingobium sp.]
MALKTISRSHRQARKAKDHVPPLPHSSWRLSPVGADIPAVPIASASEFWGRLGL